MLQISSEHADDCGDASANVEMPVIHDGSVAKAKSTAPMPEGLVVLWSPQMTAMAFSPGGDARNDGGAPQLNHPFLRHLMAMLQLCAAGCALTPPPAVKSSALTLPPTRAPLLDIVLYAMNTSKYADDAVGFLSHSSCVVSMADLEKKLDTVAKALTALAIPAVKGQNDVTVPVVLRFRSVIDFELTSASDIRTHLRASRVGLSRALGVVLPPASALLPSHPSATSFFSTLHRWPQRRWGRRLVGWSLRRLGMGRLLFTPAELLAQSLASLNAPEQQVTSSIPSQPTIFVLPTNPLIAQLKKDKEPAAATSIYVTVHAATYGGHPTATMRTGAHLVRAVDSGAPLPPLVGSEACKAQLFLFESPVDSTLHLSASSGDLHVPASDPANYTTTISDHERRRNLSEKAFHTFSRLILGDPTNGMPHRQQNEGSKALPPPQQKGLSRTTIAEPIQATVPIAPTAFPGECGRLAAQALSAEIASNAKDGVNIIVTGGMEDTLHERHASAIARSNAWAIACECSDAALIVICL